MTPSVPTSHRRARSDGERQERARHRARRALRRRDRQLRLDRRLPPLRHRHRQGAGRPSGAGIPHHLIDVVDPTDDYTAARFGRDAAAAIAGHPRAGPPADPRRRNRVLLPRADARAVSRARRATRRCATGSARIAAPPRRRRSCTACSRASIPPSAARIQPRDLVRLVRALEVYFLTGTPLTAHFADTVSPLPGRGAPSACWSTCRRRCWTTASPGAWTSSSGAASSTRCGRCSPPACRRRRGRSAASSTARCSSTCAALRDEAETRDLIVREKRRYARRQLIWFRKEPNLDRIPGPGELPAASRKRDASRRPALCARRPAPAARRPPDASIYRHEAGGDDAEHPGRVPQPRAARPHCRSASA